MPFYSVTYILPNAERGEGARFICNRCGGVPSWHRGAADQPDLPIQLRCDACLNQCAEFLTEELRDKEIAELHERAVSANSQLHIEKPKARVPAQ
jgi:hypothetical protein